MARELAGVVWRAWTAHQSGRIIGQVWVNLIQKVPNPIGERERHLYLSNLYVQPSARGGVGTALLETALEWARANGVDSRGPVAVGAQRQPVYPPSIPARR
jgi:GNAT superfamily N-acetyltransferase